MIISPILVGVDKDDHFDLIFADEGKNCLSVLIVLVVATGESFRTGNESALDGQAISNERRQSFVPMGSLSFFWPKVRSVWTVAQRSQMHFRIMKQILPL